MMNSAEKEITYSVTNSYSTLNKLTDKTKNVWFVCHGLGYLSRYFIKYFELLNADENYIIAPQAGAKQYLNGKFKHVGACWLTKENTQVDMQNVMANFDAILVAEKIPNDLNFIVMGFSQGVSVATRWLANRAIPCTSLILYAGKVPREFSSEDFKHVSEVQLYVGNQDPYITENIVASEKAYLSELFGDKIDFTIFNGKHEVKAELLASCLS